MYFFDQKLIGKKISDISFLKDFTKLLNIKNNKTSMLYLQDDYETWSKINSIKSVGIYVGEIESQFPNGNGVMTYYDGDKYLGSYKNGHFDGQGILIHVNSSKLIEQIYEGSWENGYKHGFGKKITRLTVYEGYWQEGKHNVFGIKEYAIVQNHKTSNYQRYQGEWKDGYRYGYGKTILLNGEIYEGEWRNDKRLYEKPNKRIMDKTD